MARYVSKIYSQILLDCCQKKKTKTKQNKTKQNTQLILHDFGKLKKNLPKWKIWVSQTCKTGFILRGEGTIESFELENVWGD